MKRGFCVDCIGMPTVTHLLATFFASFSASLYAIDIGPLPYLQASDSPYADQQFEYFHLEDLEDNIFNTPGATFAPEWALRTPSSVTDSVDGDDGVVDGLGRDGTSFTSSLTYDHFTVTFDKNILGALPTHVGIVWTDVGRNNGGTPTNFPLPVTFEFTDSEGSRLDNGDTHFVGDAVVTGETEEDRFFGGVHLSGISSMTLRMPGSNNWALDHIQYGFQSSASSCNGLSVTVFVASGDQPTTGADIILGSSGPDIINGLGGDDTICGLAGNDIINAGGGNDWVDGGTGRDDILGGGGDDEIFGGRGDDIMRGGGGDDDIEGEEGDDTLMGQSGNDTLDGGDGVDDINGGPGSDTIYTGSGATANTGIVASGGSGADEINGGPDADALVGSNGADIINGFGGADVITGGDGRDEIDGGNGDDDIRGQGARDILNGGAGDDVINGGEQDDIINGGSGDDDLNGGSGDDTVRGDSGADLVSGGSGDDNLVGGGSGEDVCNGQSGVDSAVGSCEILIGVEE